MGHEVSAGQITRRPWTQRELEALPIAYLTGGIAAARAALPQRRERAIYMQAFKLGLHSPRQKRRAVAKYEVTDQIDDAIRAYYQSDQAGQYGRGRQFAKRIGRPDWWVKKRAAILGLVVPREKPLDWSAAEIAVLEKHASKALPHIRRHLKAAGFVRSETAISLQLKRRHIDREAVDQWSAHALATLMGVDSKTVRRWIEVEGLPATRRGNRCANGHDEYVIKRFGLRLWIASHQQLVDLRKVDRYWFLDLAFGGVAK